MVRSFCSMGSKDKMRYIESELSVEGGSGRAIPFSLLSELEENEEIVYETRRHWATTLPYLAVGLLLSRLTNALSLFLILPSVFQMKTYEYAITEKRVLARWGLFKTRTASIPLCEIEDVIAEESQVGRKLGMGNVTVKSAERTLSFKYIEDPRAFAFYANAQKTKAKTSNCPPSDQGA